jgi:hypothetical protein
VNPPETLSPDTRCLRAEALLFHLINEAYALCRPALAIPRSSPSTSRPSFPTDRQTTSTMGADGIPPSGDGRSKSRIVSIAYIDYHQVPDPPNRHPNADDAELAPMLVPD